VSILLDKLTLDRIGPADATVGMISLPLPKEVAGHVSVDHPRSAMHPVAWWERHKTPRRALAFVLDDGGVPDKLRLKEGGGPAAAGPRPWTLEVRISREQLEFERHNFSNIQQLRGVPASECTTVEYELLLNYGGRTLTLQFGSTGPKGGPYYWQNAQVDRLWDNEVVQALRVGGVIYNEDTYLWVDVYLLLFANGVAHAAAHFVNTRLHNEGYDFSGLPLVRFAGDGVEPAAAEVPKDGLLFDLGSARLNLEPAAILCSEEHPGKLVPSDGDCLWYPVSRTFNPQVEDAPETYWPEGFARTVQFQFSLSDAKPAIARYRAPAWWYAESSEPWPWQWLPVRGKLAAAPGHICSVVRKDMTRGRFDGGSAAMGNDGHVGTGLMTDYYLTGRPELLSDALDYCYYWADLAVDHNDYTVHQWVGGWGWKTCAYLKFRDVLFGYLETGDPYLLDTVEMCAEAYWMWFRSNWPRCTMGRDAFEFGGWALLWRHLRTEHAHERMEALVRMMRQVLEQRGTIGGQMGAGPHPGFHSSLYMTGVGMTTLLEVAEAEAEEGDEASIHGIVAMVRKLHEHFNRDDVELFPSSYGQVRDQWNPGSAGLWAMLGIRIYPELARLQGGDDEVTRAGLKRSYESIVLTIEEWATCGRAGHCFVNPFFHDALLLGARIAGDGIELEPIGDPAQWPEQQTVDTPFGELKIKSSMADGEVRLEFSAAADFAVTVKRQGASVRASSNGACKLTP